MFEIYLAIPYVNEVRSGRVRRWGVAESWSMFQRNRRRYKPCLSQEHPQAG